MLIIETQSKWLSLAANFFKHTQINLDNPNAQLVDSSNGPVYISIVIATIISIKFNEMIFWQIDSYSFRFSENGTMVTEVIEVDVDNQTEVFRVPQHNDVDATDMMNDFKVVWLNILVESAITFQSISVRFFE